MDSDPDDTDDSSSPIFETARSLFNAVDGDGSAGDEFIDEIEARFDDVDNLEDMVIGGAAAGEQVMRMRERSRMTDRTSQPETAIEVRDIEDHDGNYAGTRVWIDDPQAEAFEGDEQVLIRASNGEEFEVPAPHGVAEIEQDLNDTVLELKIRPPSNDSVAIAVDGPDENGDVDAPAEGGAYECAACRALREDDRSAVDQCHDHRETPDSGAEPEGKGGETTEDHDDSPEDGDDGE